MKKAEIYMAVFWVGMCIALLIEIGVNPGTKQPIGWEVGVGPQAGWFPYYLSLIMLIWALAPMLIYVITLPWLGFYLGSTLYLIYYIRFVGKHSWKLSLSTGILFSISLFYSFEKALKLSLAKGFIEPILFMLL